MKKIVRLTESDLTRIVKRVLNEQSLKDKIKSTKQNIGGEIKYLGNKVKQKIKNRNIDWGNIKSGELNNDNFEGYIDYLNKEGWRQFTISMDTPKSFVDNNPQNEPIYFVDGIGNIHSAVKYSLKNQINQQGGAKNRPIYAVSIEHKLSGPEWEKKGMEGLTGLRVRQFYLKK